MKYLNMILAVVLLAAVGYAAQDTALDGLAEVRDPVRLKSWLEANAGDAETRIAAVEAAGVGGALASGKIIVGNSGGTGEAQTVSGDFTLSNTGVGAIASGVIVDADIKTNALIAATKLSAAAQASLALADSALQPNAVSRTNSFVDTAGLTNTIIVLQGRVTSWTVAE
jgi:hypothetical protein